MNINKLFENKEYLNNEIEFFKNKNQIRNIDNKELIKSFIKKSRHNIEFFKINKENKKFNDWLIVILYYALYHSALALITNKNYYSKNHYATLLLLIKEYSITKEEAKLFNELSINKNDAELYTNLKNDRHNASYSTEIKFNDNQIIYYEKQVIEFINKTEEIIQNAN